MSDEAGEELDTPAARIMARRASRATIDDAGPAQGGGAGRQLG